MKHFYSHAGCVKSSVIISPPILKVVFYYKNETVKKRQTPSPVCEEPHWDGLRIFKETSFPSIPSGGEKISVPVPPFDLKIKARL